MTVPIQQSGERAPGAADKTSPVHFLASLGDWLPIIEAGLRNLTVGVVPPVLDQVLIGTVDRSRNPDLKVVFVPGVNERGFPAAPARDTLLPRPFNCDASEPAEHRRCDSRRTGSSDHTAA